MGGKNITGLILCGGRSTRMENFKPLLPLGRETVIERIIGLFRSAGIEEIMVVLGHEAELLIPTLEKHGVSRVINKRYDEGMFSSVQTGLWLLNEHCRAFFLLPADIPLVKQETLQALMQVFNEQCADVCRPCYRGRRGHPPLISSALISSILDFKDPGGLRVFFSRHKGRIIDVECDDPGILMDIDTQEDYAKALRNMCNE